MKDKHLKINITVPAWMLPKIDRAAREMHMTRSAFFRWAAEKKMEPEEAEMSDSTDRLRELLDQVGLSQRAGGT